MSYRFGILAAFIISGTIVGLSSNSYAAWTCTAKGLVSASYDGGSSAYVHLQGFSRGNSYPVTKQGKVATGTTGNGTKFTCREK